MMKLSVAALALVLAAGSSAMAQVPIGPNDRLIEELRRVTDDAERTRAASPAFVATLRDLARRYAWPWSRSIVSDTFADGDYTRNPVWTVEAGRFTASFGELLSQHTPPAAAAQPAPGGQANSGAAIFGALLQEFARNQQGGAQAPVTGPVAEARIRLDAQIPNSYALSLALIPRSVAGGGFEWGVAQGTGAGYRLHYAPAAGNTPGALSLLRANPNGSAIVDSVNAPANFENGQRHTIDFTRDAVGEMVVSVDGAELIRVRDVGRRDAFTRALFVNKGGDYRIQSVAVYGTP